MRMTTPEITSDQISFVSRLLADYIEAQRARYVSRALPLSAAQFNVVKDFFPDQVLATKLLVLKNEPIQNPEFYPVLRQMGITNLPEQAMMAAVTFNDVVVSREPFSDGLLFHELVHVEQYRQLGVQRFAEFYVRGFLAGGGYHGIPLEVNAYTLGGQFESDPEYAFSVAEEVSRWIQEGRF